MRKEVPLAALNLGDMKKALQTRSELLDQEMERNEKQGAALWREIRAVRNALAELDAFNG